MELTLCYPPSHPYVPRARGAVTVGFSYTTSEKDKQFGDAQAAEDNYQVRQSGPIGVEIGIGIVVCAYGGGGLLLLCGCRGWLSSPPAVIRDRHTPHPHINQHKYPQQVIQQFLARFPHLREKGLHLSGESYGG